MPDSTRPRAGDAGPVEQTCGVASNNTAPEATPANCHPQDAQAAQVEIVKEFLGQCRRTRWARDLISPTSCDLKHWIEAWAGRYISAGAVVTGAEQLGLVVKPYREVALIGVEFDSVSVRMAERNWMLTRETFGWGLGDWSKPLEAKFDPAWWQAYREQHAELLSIFKEEADD